MGAVGISKLTVETAYWLLMLTTEIYQGMELIDQKLGVSTCWMLIDADSDFYQAQAAIKSRRRYWMIFSMKKKLLQVFSK